MGLSIRTTGDAPFGQPRPLALVLTCDGPHATPRSDTYSDASFADQLTAARADGWQIRNAEGLTLCHACRRDWWGRQRVVERPRQGTLL